MVSHTRQWTVKMPKVSHIKCLKVWHFIWRITYDIWHFKCYPKYDRYETRRDPSLWPQSRDLPYYSPSGWSQSQSLLCCLVACQEKLCQLLPFPMLFYFCCLSSLNFFCCPLSSAMYSLLLWPTCQLACLNTCLLACLPTCLLICTAHLFALLAIPSWSSSVATTTTSVVGRPVPDARRVVVASCMIWRWYQDIIWRWYQDMGRRFNCVFLRKGHL